ncbi:Beta-catenin-interacting protein 1 [Merluccius polli]|uniref:Beta-catenin-interacting protein 1 n=1 Tax=Merluccius polli TaxID=89951 RepID=A0AA47N2C4_MERPO|nr:Beta-catenin-interacting protein 1 [Merluccius polli]
MSGVERDMIKHITAGAQETLALPPLTPLLPQPHPQSSEGAGVMNREETPGKSPEEMYIQQKVRVLLMLKKMGSNLTPSEEAFLRNYAGVVHSQMSQLPQHNIDQGKVTPTRHKTNVYFYK